MSDNKWPGENLTDHPDRHVIAGGWDAIDAAPEVDGREKHRIATIFTDQSWEFVVWLPEWLTDDKEIEPVGGSQQLFVGNVFDHSKKAWLVKQPQYTGQPDSFIPKSQAVIFERPQGTDRIETPQAGLSSFGGEQ